jgi:hypothetical protein
MFANRSRAGSRPDRLPWRTAGCTLSFVRVSSCAQPRSADVRLRGALLMPLCALTLHQARYYLAFGAHAPVQLSRDGHAYLSTVEPLVLLAAALALGGFVGKLARTWQSANSTIPRHRNWTRLWATCALVLLALYCGQELCEGLFAAGHPAGLAGIVGHGGWIAIPLALLVGGALAATLRVAQALIGLATRSGARRRRDAAAPTSLRRTARGGADWRLDPRSGVVAGRAPPLARSPA